MNHILKETAKLALKNGGKRQAVIPRRGTCSTFPPAPDDVPGLSKNVLDVPPHHVGFPRAAKAATYKNPEYFCYHAASFFEAEVEMAKHRLPQPSNKPPKN